jgi:uncharacterized protein (DUF488 family)
MSRTLSIYTIGHSDHTTAAFLTLLCQYRITLVVDVRSQPYSRWASQFNREALEQDLEEAGMAYRFLGDVLGGRPSNPDLYGMGRPNYGRMNQSDAYQRGIDRLLALTRTERVAIMCSEGDYQQCHRHLLIAQTLLERGVQVRHIKPDGRAVDGERTAEQLSLF